MPKRNKLCRMQTLVSFGHSTTSKCLNSHQPQFSIMAISVLAFQGTYSEYTAGFLILMSPLCTHHLLIMYSSSFVFLLLWLIRVKILSCIYFFSYNLSLFLDHIFSFVWATFLE